jgi:hypothetical protein
MATNKYSPSVNIFRDQDLEVNYLPTPNGKRIASQIADDFQNGNRSFTIIGSYGTGKSSFLWALSNELRGKKHFFDIGGLENRKVEVLPFVGEFGSITDFFEQKFLGKKASIEQVFAEIYHRYHKLGKENALIVILLDEFGKFLEYAAKNNPEKELYFLQQLAEFVNNPTYNILLITTLHQNFDAYSFALNGAQRQEWSKVKGRFKEITFNEPVEQLLWLASERLSQDPGISFATDKVEKTTALVLKTKAFPYNQVYISSLAHKLLPLDLLSASVATLAMQKYGQNERSLFSFLEGTEQTGIKGKYDTRSNPFYNLANLYDNLVFNYYSFITSKYNPDFSVWAGIKGALERVESDIDESKVSDCIKLVKSVGLVNIFASKGANLDKNFLIQYADLCLGIAYPDLVIDSLVDKQILIYRNYQKRYVIKEGTDVDIESELLLAGDQIGEIGDVVSLLNKHFSFPAVFAKEYYYETGTPRIFEFLISKYPEETLTPKGDIDGYVNLIFNDNLTVSQVITFSKKQQGKAILYGVFKNVVVVRELLREIEKTKKTIENIPVEDRIAHRELVNIKQHQELLLNHYIFDSFYQNAEWVFNGITLSIPTKREFNHRLSIICKEIYHGTPVFRSELVNRSKLPSQIHTAKRVYFRHLVNHWHDENLGFEKNRFPPEKTIYLTLLRENGLVPSLQNTLGAINIDEKSPFKKLWEHGVSFLAKAQKSRLPLTDFSESLAMAPFKLKQGLIDFWLPTFLFLKRDEFALFGNGIYIPELHEETLELLAKSTKDYYIKAFDVAGLRMDVFNRYREFLNQETKTNLNNLVFIETIRPFLTFYKSLPEYAKHTNRLQKESIAIRQVIATATDPEKTFFEDFPTALGITLGQLKQSPKSLSDFIHRLQEAIREIRSCHDELVNRFELFIKEEVLYETLSFDAYKGKLRDRFKTIKQHRLLPHHKTLLLRLSSELDDRKAWLSSITQAIVGKTLENLRDEDEPLLYDKFKRIVSELDTLNQLSSNAIDDEKEVAIGLEITTFDSIEKKVVRFSTSKTTEVNRIEEALKAKLGKDNTLNIAALTNVLKDLLQQ